MRILVTGGAGYIGSHTAVELLKAGHDIAVLDSLCNSSDVPLERVKELTGRDFNFYRADVRDTAAVADALCAERADCVMQFAGLKAVGESVEKPQLYYDVNVGGMLSLLRAMDQSGVRKLVFSSSATVYRADNPMPEDETAGVGDCANPYGWSKLMCERLIQDKAAAEPDFSAVLLRYFNPVGAHPSGRLGEDPRGIPNNLMPYISQVAVGRREALNVFGNDYPTPDGTGMRDYIHVTDLARGHAQALTYLAAHCGCEIFNLGCGRPVSVYELLHAFEQACGRTLPHRVTARRAGDLACYYADPSKAKRVLGWAAEQDVAQMCADAWNWQSNNPHGYQTSR